jgi:hypothetical protein
MNTFKEMLGILLTSSADPTRYSLMIRGLVLAGGAYVVHAADIACRFGVTCLGIDSTIINQFAEGTYSVVYGFLLIVGVVWFIIGGIRKLWLMRWAHPDA